MKADRLRRFIDLHAWLGMVSGLALFVAFFAGAINVFHHELHHWQESHHGHEQAAGPADPDHFLQQLFFVAGLGKLAAVHQPQPQ